MTVVPESGRIKIVLTTDDTRELGISMAKIDCSDPDTRLLLRAVFQLAAYRLGKNFRSKRLLIEAYPHINGGGILYFTPLEERRKVGRLRFKHKPDESHRLNYIFKEGDGLLKAIDILYGNPESRHLRSQVWNIDDAFLLTVQGDFHIDTLHEIKEFSHTFFKGTEHIKHTREHGRALTGENAIEEIGEKISLAKHD